MTFFVKNSKYLTKYHPNLFPKSRFSKYINPCLVILFCEVQNQNKQKCASRYLYQNNNKRLHFLAQISPKSFLKISVYLVKNVKSGKTFICWEPYNKLVCISLISVQFSFPTYDVIHNLQFKSILCITQLKIQTPTPARALLRTSDKHFQPSFTLTIDMTL